LPGGHRRRRGYSPGSCRPPGAARKSVRVGCVAHCSPPPEGETQWTVRSLAAAVGIGKSQTHAILSEADLKAHQVRSWLTSIDPDFETKQAEVCGLYLDPPEGAIVVSIDEKTSVQAKRAGPERDPAGGRHPGPARVRIQVARHRRPARRPPRPHGRSQGQRLRAQQPGRVPRLPGAARGGDPGRQAGARDPRQPARSASPTSC
jgi:hypothetical protein